MLTVSLTCTLDYRLLEDTGRFADGATRDNLIRTPRSTLKVSPPCLRAYKQTDTELLIQEIVYSKCEYEF